MALSARGPARGLRGLCRRCRRTRRATFTTCTTPTSPPRPEPSPPLDLAPLPGLQHRLLPVTTRALPYSAAFVTSCCGCNKDVSFFPGLCCRVSAAQRDGMSSRAVSLAQQLPGGLLAAREKAEALGHSWCLGDKVEA